MFAHKFDASSVNITSSFSLANSILITCPASIVEILNTTTSLLAITIAKGDSTVVPSAVLATNRQQLFIPPAPSGSAAGSVKDKMKVNTGDRLFIRTDTGTASAGSAYLNTL